MPGVFTHFITTIFTYNCPLEYSNKVLDLFWIYEDKIIIDCIIHLLSLKKSLLKKMNFEV
jgi:hypothetical protein